MTTLIIFSLTAAAWLVLVAISIFSRARFPTEGLRRTERRLVIMTAVLLAVWVGVFYSPTLFAARKKRIAAVQARRSTATCASLKEGMKAPDVRRLLGEPDRVDSEADIRGPGAELWSYSESHCRVHVLDGQISHIE